MDFIQQTQSKMNKSELKSFLDEKVIQYNTLDFIDSDPVQIPHLFSQKEDIEIAGFFECNHRLGQSQNDYQKRAQNDGFDGELTL